jgi:cobalt-precorrin 5A hydrolase
LGLAVGDAGYALAGGEAMIVAGIGCRRGATAEAVLATVAAALAQNNVAAAQLVGLAVPEEKMHEAGIIAAADKLALPVMAVSPADLERAGAGALTYSERVQNLKGVPSVSEAAALAAAGSGARLIAARITTPTVTCALATGGGA